MTKLEELKAAWDAAEVAYVAVDADWELTEADVITARKLSYAASAAAYAAADAAYYDYMAELERQG